MQGILKRTIVTALLLALALTVGAYALLRASQQLDRTRALRGDLTGSFRSKVIDTITTWKGVGNANEDVWPDGRSEWISDGFLRASLRRVDEGAWRRNAAGEIVTHISRSFRAFGEQLRNSALGANNQSCLTPH